MGPGADRGKNQPHGNSLPLCRTAQPYARSRQCIGHSCRCAAIARLGSRCAANLEQSDRSGKGAGKLNSGNGSLGPSIPCSLRSRDRRAQRPRTSLYTTSGITDCDSGASRSLAQGLPSFPSNENAGRRWRFFALTDRCTLRFCVLLDGSSHRLRYRIVRLAQPRHDAFLIRRRPVLAGLPFSDQPAHRNFDPYDRAQLH